MKLKMSISFTTDLNAIKAFVHRSGIIINYNKQNTYYLSKVRLLFVFIIILIAFK